MPTCAKELILAKSQPQVISDGNVIVSAEMRGASQSVHNKYKTPFISTK